MKKILGFTLALLLVMSVFFALPASASVEAVKPIVTIKEDGFTYYVNVDGTATVCGLPSDTTDVVIPSEIGDRKVVKLGGYQQRIENSMNVKSLTVPEGVLYLEWCALSSMKNIEEISLPSSLIEIEYQDFFSSCTYYNNPDNWDSGVLYIGTNLIDVGRDVPEVLVVREDTTCVSKGAVRYSDTVIKKVVFPNHPVPGIEALTTKTLEKATVPSGMETVTDYLFSGCVALTDVTVEDGITAIGTGAFSSCSSLDEIVIPESVTSIGKEAFVNCKDLKQVYVPSTVTSIDEHALGYEKYSAYDYFEDKYYFKYRVYNDFSICGALGSAAHEYAQENNIPFVASSDEPDPVIPTRDEACFGKVGDANLDRDVNIKDATAIQKHLASLDELSENGLVLADTDDDGVITIKDATVVQKYIASLDTDTAVGDATDLRLYYRVYAKIGEDWRWTEEKHYFNYYKNEYGDMIAQPGLEAEFDAVAGGWGAYIPAEANYVCFSVWEYDTIYMPMPECDGMIMVPSDCVWGYTYDCSWQSIN